MKKLASLALLMLLSKVYGQQINLITTINNVSGNSTYLDMPSCNDNPQAIILAEIPAYWQYDQLSKLYKEPSAPNTILTHSNIGVWYNNAKKQWAIFNEDKSYMPSGITFKVTVRQPGDSVFTITSAGDNMYNGKLVANHRLLNENNAASFLMTQNWNRGQSATGIYNGEIMAEYNPALQRWLISNRNGTPLPIGVSINFMVKPAASRFSINTISNKTDILINMPKKNPLANHKFRLICEGFSVVQATSDDILESDGPGDEMFFTFNVFEFANGFSYADVDPMQHFFNSATQKYELKTGIHGTSQLGWPVSYPSGFVKAGTAKNIGGLRATDEFLPAGASEEMLPGTAFFDRLNPKSFPLIVWEGTLTDLSQVIVLTCPWEWDGNRPEGLQRESDLSPVQNNWSSITAIAAYNYSLCHHSLDYKYGNNFWLPEGKQSIAPVFNNLDNNTGYNNLTLEVEDKFPYWKDKSGTQPFRTSGQSRVGPMAKNNETTTRPDIAPLLIRLDAIDSAGNPVIGNVAGSQERLGEKKFFFKFYNNGNGEGVYKVYFRFEKMD